MMSAWEWPAVASVKHLDSSVLNWSSHLSAVSWEYDSSIQASQDQLPVVGTTAPCYSFLSNCVQMMKLFNKKRKVRHILRHSKWAVRVTWEDWLKQRYEGVWKVKDLKGGLCLSRSVIETISCVCVYVCANKPVKGLGQRPCLRSFTKHGHITETQWKFPLATAANIHRLAV